MSEFKNLPSGWKVVRLGEIGKVINGLTYSPDNVSNNGLLVLRSSNINNNSIVLNNDDVYVKGISKFNKTLENDILICVRNGSKNLIGKSALITEKYKDLAFGAFMAIFRSNYNLFLIHIFKTNTFFKQVKNDLGATINSINNGNLLNFKIPLPPLDEQEKIAEILSTWDEAINLTINLIENKKQFKKALMQNLLTAKIRFPRFKDEWKKIKMNDIFTEIDERSIANNQYEILSVTLNGIVPQNIHFKKRIASKDNSGYKILRYGNLVIGMNLWMGGIDILTNQNIGIVSPAYRIFKIDDKYNIYFLRNFIKTKKMLELYVLHSEQGASVVRRNLNLSELLEEKIKLPNLKEQQKIAEVLTACNDEINLLILKLENLKKQKQGLMQKLLSGKVRVK